MSERLPDPNTLSRQPGHPSAGADAPREDEITPEQAVEEARRGRETAERSAAQERERATTAARERDEAQRQAADAGSQAWTAQERAIGQSIQAQTALAEQAKQSIATAQAAGDHVAVADAFDRLAEARAALRDLGNQKTYIDNLKAQRQQTPAQQQPSNLVTVSTPGGQMPVSPGAKQWMDEHPRFYSDGAYYNHAVAAHGTIVADGIQIESPAYFRALNDRMQQFERFEAFERGDSQPQGEPMKPQQPTQRRASSMGAPVSRTTGAPPSNPRTAPGGPIDPMIIAQRLGPSVTETDLREFARINGYTKTLTDDAGFQRYLKEQDDIFRIDQAGGETGIKYDSVYR